LAGIKVKRGKRKVLERYERKADGTFILDVAAPKVEDLYEFYDRTAPYVKRDLDQDLVEYLIACARELRSEDFVIRLTLESSPGEDQLARVKNSITNFFSYLTEMERHKTHNLVRRSMVLLGIGLGIFAISVWVNAVVEASPGVVQNVLAEGLTVAAWVSLWESLAIFIIDWGPQRRNIKLYDRLAGASVELRPASVPVMQKRSATEGG
jgi:hypothetical protein